MSEHEEAPTQPAPSPTTINVPAGSWSVRVAKGNGQEVSSAEVVGPLTLVVSLVGE